MNCPSCQKVNAEGARFCSHCGAALAVARPAEGERKFVTVLFADVVGSTAMGEELDPEQIIEIMNGAFAFMNAAVARYGGTVARLMGDAILAFFGAPAAHEDDAERAVRAGLEIQAAAAAYGQTIEQRFGFDFRVRVGINTGMVVLAIVGNEI
jgi:class 3 adenylate cyclase